MTFGSLENTVREIVQDVPAPQRFSAGYILSMLCEAIESLRSKRSDARYFNLRIFDWKRPAALRDWRGTSINDGLTPEQVEELRGFVPYIDARFNRALVYYAASKVFTCDATDTANLGLAASNMALYEAEAQG